MKNDISRLVTLAHNPTEPRPNPKQIWSEFWAEHEEHLSLFGSAYILECESMLGSHKEYWIIDPMKIMLVEHKDGGKWYKVNGKEPVSVPVEKVIATHKAVPEQRSKK